MGVVFAILLALVFVAVIWKVGIGMLRSVTEPLPAPPPAGEMRRVSLRYRCSICGVELKMTLAYDQEPEPPRHCQEDMDLMAPID
ncbi:MAG: hypothetical protein QOD72_941 [Acidimicrobiaceae bacterium]|jgi:hypothetical protein|nr:hypothetical protein [Acidimicrobiaceae bacterium]